MDMCSRSYAPPESSFEPTSDLREQLAAGHRLIAAGETTKAISTLQELCSGHQFRGAEASLGAMCHEALAKALQQQGLGGASVRAMAAAVGLDPMDASLRVRHGISRASTGDHSTAIAEYEAALGIFPGLTLAHSHWGVSLHALGEKQGALQQFEVPAQSLHLCVQWSSSLCGEAQTRDSNPRPTPCVCLSLSLGCSPPRSTGPFHLEAARPLTRGPLSPSSVTSATHPSHKHAAAGPQRRE